jgi:hypothetical protein
MKRKNKKPTGCDHCKATTGLSKYEYHDGFGWKCLYCGWAIEVSGADPKKVPLALSAREDPGFASKALFDYQRNRPASLTAPGYCFAGKHVWSATTLGYDKGGMRVCKLCMNNAYRRERNRELKALTR